MGRRPENDEEKTNPDNPVNPVCPVEFLPRGSTQLFNRGLITVFTQNSSRTKWVKGGLAAGS